MGLTVLHWVYLGFIALILGLMAARRDTNLACIGGIALLGLLAKGTVSGATAVVFNALVYAGAELLGIILIISVIAAMSRALEDIGANTLMVAPVVKLMKTPGIAFWTVGLVMMVASWFFWPSPAVALIGAVLLPAALAAGLPAIGVAMAMNLFGHGIALSGDFFIQGAPTLTAKAAGLPVSDVIAASVPLVAVMGVTTTVAAYLLLRRQLGQAAVPLAAATTAVPAARSSNLARAAAVLVPVLFVLDVIMMVILDLRGGDATALVGGTAVLILLAVTVCRERGKALEQVTRHFVGGLQFGIRVFGPVIPIAAFFFLGDEPIRAILGNVLPAGSLGILGDLGRALASSVPVNQFMSACALAVAGGITGLDGSGFSGISLAGSLGKLFGTALGGSAATLTALGQISAIWVGGGTLVPWGLIPAAAICGVDPIELARRNFLPVLIGLGVTTVVAVFLI